MATQKIFPNTRLLRSLAPGVGALDKEKFKPEAAAEKHEHTKAHEPQGDLHGGGAHDEHAHHEITPKELRKLILTQTLKASLGILGMLIGLFIAGIPGFGLIGLMLSPILGIILFKLGGKEPEGGH